MKQSLLIFILTLFFSPCSLAENFNQIYQEYLTSQKGDNYTKTVELAEKLVSLGEVKYGAQSENSVNLKYNLAIAYATNHNFQNAFDTMEIVTSDYKTRHGEHSEQLFVALLEQLTYFPKHSALNVTKKALKPKAKQAIEIANYLAQQSKEKTPFYYYQLSKVIMSPPIIYHVNREAKKYTQLAYEGLMNSVGKNDHRTIKMQFKLASIKMGTRKFNQAIELYENLISSVSSQLETSHPYELAARTRLIEIYERKGESEKATEHCIEIGRMTPWEQDLEPMPLYRINPRYPIDSAKRGKEGWVKMSFTIDKMGFVTEAKLIEVKGGNNFGRESLKALEKWRYAPKFVNGQAIAAKEVTIQMDFKLDKT